MADRRWGWADRGGDGSTLDALGWWTRRSGLSSDLTSLFSSGFRFAGLRDNSQTWAPSASPSIRSSGQKEPHPHSARRHIGNRSSGTGQLWDGRGSRSEEEDSSFWWRGIGPGGDGGGIVSGWTSWKSTTHTCGSESMMIWKSLIKDHLIDFHYLHFSGESTSFTSLSLIGERSSLYNLFRPGFFWMCFDCLCACLCGWLWCLCGCVDVFWCYSINVRSIMYNRLHVN